MNPILEIFSQGEEIITGQTVDTNAAWLSQQAVRQGFSVTRHTAVGDKLEDLAGLLKEISQRADCCICTGGLGPTSDDLTTEAVSKAFGLPLIFDSAAYAQIQAFFTHRNKPMPEANSKQAMLPSGAQKLDNEWGTAPGFALQAGRCWFAFLPGVPSEMKPMFLEKILPTLPKRFVLKPRTLITIKTIGIGESDIQQRISTVAIPGPVQLGFRASISEVQTKLLFPHGYPEPLMAALIDDITCLLGDAVYAIDRPESETDGLASVVDSLMNSHGKSLAVVETISQGLLAGLCVGSGWLLESRYEQSLPKLGLGLQIDLDLNDLAMAAKRIASAIKLSSNADFVLVQLFGGDRSCLHDKNQAVTLHNVLLTDTGHVQETLTVAGSSKRKQQQSALLALDLLRRHLQKNLPIKQT